MDRIERNYYLNQLIEKRDNKNNLRLFSIRNGYSSAEAPYFTITHEYWTAEAGSESEPSGRRVRAKRTTRKWQADSLRDCFLLRRTRFETTALFCHSYTDVLMKERCCFKEAAAKHGFAVGKRMDCRRQFKKGVSGQLLIEIIVTINGSNIFL